MEMADNSDAGLISACLYKFDFIGKNPVWKIINDLEPPTDLHQLVVFVTMFSSFHFDKVFCSDQQTS